MNTLRGILSELYGLVVEDFSLAAGILIVVAFAYFVLPLLGLSPELQATIWVSALLLLLLENVYRSSRR